MRSAPAPPHDRQEHRIAAIDGFRGIAIFGVVAVHALLVSNPIVHVWSIDLTKLLIVSGRYGVELFFVLSGLTITLSLRRHLTTESRPYRSYFIKRFFRLSPMYYAVLAAAALLGYAGALEPGTRNPPPDGLNYLLHLTYLHGWFPDYVRSILGPAWSLTPEVVFYCAIPPILLFCRSWRSRLIFFAVTIVVSRTFFANWSAWLSPNQTNLVWVSIAPMRVFFLFAGGVCLADLYDWHGPRQNTTNALIKVATNTAFAVAAGAFFWMHYRDFDAIWAWLMIIVGVGSYCLGSTWAHALGTVPPLRWLGTVSYSVFLVHFPIVEWTQPWGPRIASVPDLPRYLIALSWTLGVSVAVSALTYRYVEQPGMAVGNRVVRRLESRTHLLGDRLVASR